ncbi:MAG: hypothetical protein ACK5M0_04815 [Bacteroidales bacterium]
MKTHSLFLFVLGIFILNSCTHTPAKIEKYINKHCDFSKTDTCFIDLRKALVDYDTMYVFDEFTVVTGVRDIIGITDYPAKENEFVGYDSEMCRIILVKNHKVVYEDEYHYWDYNTSLDFWEFSVVKGQGIFDKTIVEESGYRCINYIFKVTRSAETDEIKYVLELVK